MRLLPELEVNSINILDIPFWKLKMSEPKAVLRNIVENVIKLRKNVNLR